jgi:hypothetical protein
MAVFWLVTLCRSHIGQRFVGKYRLHLQGWFENQTRYWKNQVANTAQLAVYEEYHVAFISTVEVWVKQRNIWSSRLPQLNSQPASASFSYPEDAGCMFPPICWVVFQIHTIISQKTIFTIDSTVNPQMQCSQKFEISNPMVTACILLVS